MTLHSSLEWSAPRLRSVDGESFAVRHLWCVGRNYAEHAREMGVDPARSEPIFFSKPAQAAVQQERVAYPTDSRDLHHEVELAVLLAAGGRAIPARDWPERIWGYAVAVDLTRRDAQARFKAAGQPWELSKGFDQSAPMGLIVPASRWQPRAGTTIELCVEDRIRQRGCLGDMIWPVAQLLEQLSRVLTLNAGDVILTGTPAGVGPVERGEWVEARIEGLPSCRFEVV
jgi:fumarylpyruvate hydrolase